MSLCQKCSWWVDCETKGFCDIRDLFTYTDEEECKDFHEGTPMKDYEWEELNDPTFWYKSLNNKYGNKKRTETKET